MTHRKARRSMSALLDGELHGEPRAALDRHLELCRRCRRHLRELRAAETLLRTIPANLLPLSTVPENEARLLALARWWAPPPAPRTWPGPALLGLAATLGLALLVWVNAPAAGVVPAGHEPLVVASRVPTAFLAPNLAAPVSVPYTWSGH